MTTASNDPIPVSQAEMAPLIRNTEAATPARVVFGTGGVAPAVTDDNLPHLEQLAATRGITLENRHGDGI